MKRFLPATKNGFTVVEIITAMVVIALSGLLLSVCTLSAYRLQAEASFWQKDAALLMESLALNTEADTNVVKEKVSLVLDGAKTIAPNESDYSAFSYTATVDSMVNAQNKLVAVYAFFEKTVDANDLLLSEVAPLNAPAPGAVDPFYLGTPGPDICPPLEIEGAGNKDTLQKAVLYAGGITLKPSANAPVVESEFLYLNGDITIEKPGYGTISLTLAPHSGNDQPLLLYLPKPVSIINAAAEGSSTPLGPAGWYALPPGTNLLTLTTNTLRDYALSPLRYGKTAGDELSAEQQQALSALLDAAHARLVLANVSLS